MGLRFTSGQWEREPYGLPVDWLDADGFPRSLRAALREVEARGGRIVGSGYEWRVVAPELGMTTMGIRFVKDDPDAGDVAVRIDGSEYPILIDIAHSHRVEPGRTPSEPDMTGTDSVVVGIIDGGYHEWVAFNDADEWVERGWRLEARASADGNRITNTDLPAQRRLAIRRQRRDFPGWSPR